MEEINNINTDRPKEESVIKCRHCKQTKVRTLTGYYPNGKDKRWVDIETGREFNGRLCPPCDSEKKSRVQRLKRRVNRVKREAEYDKDSAE
jgi:Zn finger protein HypA/HybF involved in hydrogenase expression